MTHFSANTVIDLPSSGKLSRGEPLSSHDSQLLRYAPCSRCLYELSQTRPTGNSSSSTPVHLLDDDSLLIILSFCRPVILDESAVSGYDADYQVLDKGNWNRERWWYGLIQVCRRWRYLVLDSAFHLQVSLVCARGTPVADMLAHSPPLPLIIDHIDGEYDLLSPEDEEGIIFALQHRDRVRRIRIRKSVSISQRLVIALDGEFPVLEYLSIDDRLFIRPLVSYITNLNVPETFRAPHIRELLLDNFATPIESPQLTTMGNLVTLWLTSIPSSAYFFPNVLLQRLSLMPQLETLGIAFNCYHPSRERQLLRTPIMTQVTLPNLHWLFFVGTATYLEMLLPWVTIPLLKRLYVDFFNRMIYSIPQLRRFMSAARNLRLKTATVTFDEDHLKVMVYPNKDTGLYTLEMGVGGRHLDWQVVSAAQVFHELKTVFSAVEHLSLNYGRHNISSEWNRQADRSHWGELLGSFGKVKTLFVGDRLVKQVSRALQPGEGESPTELLPELQELSYPKRGASRASSRAFTLFIDARRKAGRPVIVNRF